MILSGVEDNHTSVIVLVQKERGKTDHNQGNYSSSHYIERRDQNLSRTNEHLELLKPQRRANHHNYPMRYHKSSQCHQLFSRSTLVPSYHPLRARVHDYRPITNIEVTITWTRLECQQFTADPNIVFTVLPIPTTTVVKSTPTKSQHHQPYQLRCRDYKYV